MTKEEFGRLSPGRTILDVETDWEVTFEYAKIVDMHS